MNGAPQRHPERAGNRRIRGSSRLAARRLPMDMPAIESLRGRFEASMGALEEVYINGRGGTRLPTVSNISFRYTEGPALLAAVTKNWLFPRVRLAPLHPGTLHVLTSMGLGRDLAFSSCDSASGD